MFEPEKGREKPVIRRALDLYAADGIPVVYHHDTVEIRFGKSSNRFYSTWSQFLAEAEALFGDRLLEGGEESDFKPRTGFTPQFTEFEALRKAEAAAVPPAAAAVPPHEVNGRAPEAVSAEKTAENAARVAEAAGALGSAPVWSPKAPPFEQIRTLRAQVKLLERAIYVVGKQSEDAQKEVERLRQELEGARVEMSKLTEARPPIFGTAPDRYRQLRQLVVRKLHPDVPGTDMEKAYREELFKSIWSEIEQFDKK